MLFNMKPTCKQLDSLRVEIANAKNLRGLSYAEIARKSSVDPSQVTRICHGQFKTLSHNVMHICMILDVKVPKPEPRSSDVDPEWAGALASMRKLWDETPEGAKKIARMLEAIAEHHTKSEGESDTPQGRL